MLSTTAKTNSNVRDNQNGSKAMIFNWVKKEIELLLENFFIPPLPCSFSCCSRFSDSIQKSLGSTFLSGVELH